MTNHVWRAPSLTGITTTLLFAAAIVARSLVRTVDGASSQEWAQAVDEAAVWTQVSGLLHAVTGVALAAFAGALFQNVRSWGGQLPYWGLLAGLAWGMLFVVGGIFTFAAVEMAGYQVHPEGAKTSLILGHLVYTNPIAAALGGALAIACGARSGWPKWFRNFSRILGGLTVGIAVIAGVGGVGLVSMGPLLVWFVTTSIVLPVRLARAPSKT